MSILSVARTPRRRALVAAPAAAVAEPASATLEGMRRGQRAVVEGIESLDDPAAARRLFDLGFVPGAPVEMVRRAPLADPVVFRVAGYEIALRREQARWVRVCAEVA